MTESRRLSSLFGTGIASLLLSDRWVGSRWLEKGNAFGFRPIGISDTSFAVVQAKSAHGELPCDPA